MNARRSDSLPPSVLRPMRVLFDSLDVYRGGHVRLADFSARWNRHAQERAHNQRRSASAPGEGFDKLPSNFLSCLQKVAPPNGLVTFERFCAALRLATAESARTQNGASILDKKVSSHPVVEFRRPNIYSSQPESVQSSYNPVLKSNVVDGQFCAPIVPYKSPETQRKLAELQNWYLERAVPAESDDDYRHSRISSQSSLRDRQHRFSTDAASKGLDIRPRNPKLTDGRLRPAQWEVKGPGHRFAKPPPAYQSSPSTSPLSDASPPVSPEVRLRKPPAQRRAVDSEHRNTTFEEASLAITNKHKRLLTEERDLLRRGSEVSRKLTEWYGDRMAALDKKERLVSGSDHGVHEERLNYLRAHVTEVNRRANTLVESSEKGFPSALNMEFNRNVPQPADDQVRWLKDQVRLLSEEGRAKDSRIAALEKDRTLLLRELSNWKCRVEGSSLDFGQAEEATLI